MSAVFHGGVQPEELRAAGGPTPMLEGLGAVRVRVFEFAFDMDQYAEQQERRHTIGLLVPFHDGEEAEAYIHDRLKELNLSPGENRKLQQLLAREEIREKLKTMQRLMGRVSAGAGEEIRTSDMLLYLVRSLHQMESGLEGVDETNLARVFSHLFDHVNRHLSTTLEDARDMPHRKVLDRVARQTISSPKALIEWLEAPLDAPPPVLSRKGKKIELTWCDAANRIDDKFFDDNKDKKLIAEIACEEKQVQIVVPQKHPAQQTQSKAASA